MSIVSHPSNKNYRKNWGEVFKNKTDEEISEEAKKSIAEAKEVLKDLLEDLGAEDEEDTDNKRRALPVSEQEGVEADAESDEEVETRDNNKSG